MHILILVIPSVTERRTGGALVPYASQGADFVIIEAVIADKDSLDRNLKFKEFE